MCVIRAQCLVSDPTPTHTGQWAVGLYGSLSKRPHKRHMKGPRQVLLPREADKTHQIISKQVVNP